MNKLVEAPTQSPRATVEAVLSGLKIGPRDSFKITGSARILAVHVKKPDGTVQSARMMAKGSFQQLTSFDPSALTLKQRWKLTRELYADGLSQAEIGNLLGISQATVSLDLKRK